MKQALVLGMYFVLINCILTFVYLDLSTHMLVSYMTVPGIVGAAIWGLILGKNKNQSFIISLKNTLFSLLLALAIGFSSLFILNTTFIDMVGSNPVVQMKFQQSGVAEIESYLQQSTLQDALQSTMVSMILTTLVVGIGSLVIRKKPQTH